MKKTEIELFGLIGYPVKHSLSPAIHNSAFKKFNISGDYSLYEKKPEELESFFKGLDDSDIYGLNVTVPYKEKVLKFVELEKEDVYLKIIQSVNTIVRIDSKWLGFNTDIPGFEISLKENFNPANKKTAMIGAGGAARSVAYVLAKSGVQEICIFDIDKIRSKSIVSMVKELFPNMKISAVDSIEALNIKEKDLLVNATPVGLNKEDPCLVKKGMLHKDLFVYDLIYNPIETKLLFLAKEVGAQVSNGLGMLLYQGALSFVLFTGTDVAIKEIVDEMRIGLNEGIQKLCMKK
ncbi:MAG: shikimate dehydrogenase [Candidatus Omnitrophica bacterium]|nr:shikimate dehydrogenase [Candidatus Omnitrophota bacterium]